MDREVAVIVPTWNRREAVLGCVATLLQSESVRFAVVVVDNGSVDGTSEALLDRFGDSIVLLRNATNLGYAGGNNVGIRWAIEQAIPYVCLVNNDAEVTPHYLREMLDAAGADTRIGALGCRNLQLEEPSRLWGAYGSLTYGPFVVRMEGQGVPDGGPWRTVRDVDWVIGNGSLWKCSAVQEVGFLDEEFFAYHDDVDWSVRFRDAGYRVVYDGRPAILHRGGGTSDARQEHRFPLPYFLARNGLLFVRKHASGSETARYLFWSLSAMLLRWARALFSRLPGVPDTDRQGHRYWDWEVSYACGWVDGLRGGDGLRPR